MNKYICILSLVLIFGCNQKSNPTYPVWITYDETDELSANSDHESERMRYKLIQSKFLNKDKVRKDIVDQIDGFSESDYHKYKPLILEQDIPSLQKSISDDKLSYEVLVKWYLYRILLYENNPSTSLHTIIAINKDAVNEAIAKDKNRQVSHPIFGMPILLKDNIGASGMPTTAGAEVLKNNMADDAHITKRLTANGAIILGKVNLSEWAYFLCEGCPLGYSAIGGQTLNPYGRMQFETGGSSAGSGTSTAANYAVAAVGTETAGSILSPSSHNSVVGLKPTVGVLGRTGIVPISSSLDTPGPMTKNVTDNAILLSAMSGEDTEDSATKGHSSNVRYWSSLDSASLAGKRIGAMKNYMEDSLYAAAMSTLKDEGAEVIVFEPGEFEFDGFVTFLNADMRVDLPQYLNKKASSSIKVNNVVDIVNYNAQDSLRRVPYGQSLFEGIVAEDITSEDFAKLKKRFHTDGVNYFENPMQKHDLDAIAFINNYNAGHAAMAKYPCITVPMGYQASGEPKSLTLTARPYEEQKLLHLGYAYEQATKHRQPPANYK